MAAESGGEGGSQSLDSGPDMKNASSKAKGGGCKADRMEVDKEGAFFLGQPTFFDFGGGRLRCLETGHELRANEKDAYSRTKACRLGLIDAAVAKKRLPLDAFQLHPTSRAMLLCKLTGDTVNKTEEHIWKHVTGKKFLHKLEQKEMEKHASAEGEKDAKQQKKQQNMNISCKQGRQTDEKNNKSLNKHTKAESMVIEEPNLSAPHIGSHLGFDDGKDCWDLLANSNDEGDGVNELDGPFKNDDPDATELSIRTKRMSIAVGPSSFASRKKKIKKGS
ncbi:uncharacterized protein LOC122052309 [Zingiber officinale]|uniref:Surfeit locus protein 2 n=1 Tax=Zingiber officinale TaxID=94328 RepID=A0A8J5LB94_ZINOF|nr:uncharacterized protein LOC122052309 [Zingiber officinale]KAG6521712.1 hypothetical protein ZIOFF_018837 [Zingiber officinale]